MRGHAVVRIQRRLFGPSARETMEAVTPLMEHERKALARDRLLRAAINEDVPIEHIEELEMEGEQLKRQWREHWRKRGDLRSD